MRWREATQERSRSAVAPDGGAAADAPPPSAEGQLLVAPGDRIVAHAGYGRTARRVTMAIVLTAALPLLASIVVGKSTIDRLSAMATQPELGAALERALAVYVDLASALKESMRHEVAAMASDPRLRTAAGTPDIADDERALAALAVEHPRAVTLALDRGDASPPSVSADPSPGDPSQVASGGPAEAPPTGAAASQVAASAPATAAAPAPGPAKRLTVRAPVPGSTATLVATLETSGARFAEQQELATFLAAYRELEGARRHAYVERPYLLALTMVMVLTIACAVLAGAWVARPVTRGVERLSRALRAVAGGDLRPRVIFDADDELGALGRTLNATLLELERSRSRVEFLRHMGEWQKVARRLAHEIRNPLTPIQLAVQECQRRYPGSDAEFERLLHTTVEVVEEEVSSLRRLVGRFARFARLPDAEPVPCDLGDVLREQVSHLRLSDPRDEDDEAAVGAAIEIALETAPGPLPTLLDREMFHRALLNLVRNAAQAIASKVSRGRGAARDAPASRDVARGHAGHVFIRAGQDEQGVWVAVDDDGPGIDPVVATTLFDPYVTTKHDGTGLGLAIVKKIALDHGGTVEAARSPEGGARLLLRLPGIAAEVS